jgi:hypothetical protein
MVEYAPAKVTKNPKACATLWVTLFSGARLLILERIDVSILFFSHFIQITTSSPLLGP